MNLFPVHPEKLKQLILHICRLYKANSAFNLADLGNILFYADFNHFKNYGFPITGQAYIKQLDGFAPTRLLSLCQQMHTQKKINLSSLQTASFSAVKIKAYTNAALNLFDGQEIALVDEIIFHFHKQKFITPLSPHYIAGTELIHLQEDIPYYLALIENKRFHPNAYEAKYAEQLKTLAHQSRVLTL